jgi:hypothetical protein
MKVFGAFRPSSHNSFYGCTMQDGSTIDLANRTGEGLLPFHLTCAMTGESANCQHKSVKFAPKSTVAVDLSKFTTKSIVNTYVLTWDEMPSDDVKFEVDAITKSKGYTLLKDEDGLRFVANKFLLMIR